MHRVLLLGAGKIGRMIAKFLGDAGDYELVVGDAHATALRRLVKQRGREGKKIETVTVDCRDRDALAALIAGFQSVISALSFDFNPLVADVAQESGASYFDLTEDVATTRRVRAIAERAAEGQIFVPQCGLAPGFVSIIAQHLTRSFEQLESVRLRVGALPLNPSNAMMYNLTWSTDGLINEYCEPCETIHNGRRYEALPLEGLENFSLDGVRYEAFNTSGGLGTLCESLDGRVRELNYKTIRYVGHRELLEFLLNGLRLRDDRAQLKKILEGAVPITYRDVVVIFCSVTGKRNDQLVEHNFARKINYATLEGERWSAIQLTTAAGLCSVVDLHVQGKLPTRGFVRQEDVHFDDFRQNRFGRRWFELEQVDELPRLDA